MDNIKQINTGVAELLAVKVPVTGMKYNLETDGDNYILFFGDGKDMRVRLLHSGYKYEIVGISDQLTEEQCREVMPKPMVSSKGSLGFMVSEMDTEIYSTAKEAFASLMQANECYTENPLEYKLQSTQDNFENSKCDNTEVQIVQDLYDEAELNTGNWLILKKQK